MKNSNHNDFNYENNYMGNDNNTNENNPIDNNADKISSKEKNIAIATGILLVVILLFIISFVAKDANSDYGKINEEQDIALATNNVDEMSDSSDYSDVIDQGNTQENEETQDENNEEIDDSNVQNTPASDSLSTPVFKELDEDKNKDKNKDKNEDESEREQIDREKDKSDKEKEESKPKKDNEEQQNVPEDNNEDDNNGFSMKKYNLTTEPKKSIKIRLKGTAKAKVEGVYIYTDKKGKVVTKKWEETLDKDGEGTLKFRAPSQVTSVELQINNAIIYNKEERREEIVQCYMEGYDI